MLRVALVGAGYFSRFHLQGWAAIADASVVALCDSDPHRAQAMAADFAIGQVFDDAATMLDTIKPDLLDIVTPPPTHLPLVNLAAQRRLTTICQKPLAPTLSEATELTGVMNRAKTSLVVHENFRFSPWYRESKRLIESATLGQLHSVAFRLRPGDGQGTDAYLARQPYFQQMPRFLVHETAIHFIDTFRFLMGEVNAVTARLRRVNPVIVGEDAGYILFEFAAGSTGLFDGNRLNEHNAEDQRRTMGEMWLEGSAGVLRLTGDGRLHFKPYGQPEAEHSYDRGDSSFAGGACERLQQHVVDHLCTGTALENTGEQYLRNLRIEEAVYESSRSGRRIEIR